MELLASHFYDRIACVSKHSYIILWYHSCCFTLVIFQSKFDMRKLRNLCLQGFHGNEHLDSGLLRYNAT